jgi:hypothetical protein
MRQDGGRGNIVEDTRDPPGWAIPLVIILILTVVAIVLLAPSYMALPSERVLCDDCHEAFVPFQYTIEAPSMVPVDETFELSVTMYNEEIHAIYNPSALLTIEDPDGLVLAMVDPEPQVYNEQGTLGFRETNAFSFTILPGAQSAVFTLDGSGGLLDDIDLSVDGPGGTGWTSDGSSLDETVSLSAEDLQSGGYGDYTATVSHPNGIRRASYGLQVEVVYGTDAMLLWGPDDIQGGDSYTFVFDLVGTLKGPNQVQIVLSGTCVHHHESGDNNERDFSREETLVLDVGNEFVYGTPGGGDDGGGPDGDFLAGGRYLGFVAAALLGISIATSGHIQRFPRRERFHCWSSYAMAGTFGVHWAMLWLGPYGSTLGGFATGWVLLVSIALLTLTGVRPSLLDERVLGLPWKKLHRLVTYLLVVVLAIHAVLNGTDLAFLRP